MMGALESLAWYNVFFLFGLYSVLLSVIVRVFRIGHVLGVVYGIALMLAYLTRSAVMAGQIISPSMCITMAFACLVISNCIVELGIKGE